tara:strand:- start:27 stop:512 length:486 start_codon:yes stop_codon:yes gene_type:complete
MTISPNSLTYLCELTEFPKLFAKTYWGGFEYESKKDDELIKNRNDFAKKYFLNKKSWCRDKIPYEYKLDIRCKGASYQYRAMASQPCSGIYDHFECYRTKIAGVDSLILIVSNHESEIPKSIIDEQWEIVPPMYSRSSVTWQLIVSVAELKLPLNKQEKNE